MFSILSFDPVVSASGTIFNPYYEFPPDRSVQVVRVGGAPEETTPKTKIVEPCKITLSKQRIVLLFDDTGIAFRFHSEEHGKRLFDGSLSIVV